MVGALTSHSGVFSWATATFVPMGYKVVALSYMQVAIETPLQRNIIPDDRPHTNAVSVRKGEQSCFTRLSLVRRG